LTLNTKDGCNIRAIVHAQKITYQGKPADLVTLVDITEHKQIEQELMNAEAERLQTLTFIDSILSGMSDIVLIADEDYTIRFMNDAARRLHGDVVGQKCFKVIRNLEGPCYHNGVPCEVHELLEKGGDYFEDTRLSPVIGRITHIHATPTIMPDGKRAVVMVSRDVTEETRAKEQLEKAYSKLRATLESTADGILVVDSQEKITEFNNRFLQMLQVPESIMESRDDRRLLSFISDQLQDPEGFMRRTRELFAQPDLEYSDLMMFKDGRVYERYSRPQKLGGKTVGRVISLRDITERRRVEEALKSSLEFSSSLMEYYLNPILVVDQDTSIRYVNPALERLTGYSSKELLGRKPPYPWWPMDKIKETTKRLEENMRRGLTHYEENFRNKNGEDFWVEINAASIIRDGELKYYLSSWVDITERKKMEQEIKNYSEHLESLVKERTQEVERSKRFLEMIIENVPDLLYIKDRELKYIQVNNSFCRFFGVSKSEALGKTLYDLTTKDRADYFTKQDKEVLETGETFYMSEGTITDASGQERVICTIKTPLKDERGNVTHVIGVTRDITENKRLESELLKAERMAAIGETAAMVGHDLRNPLQVVVNLIYLVEEILKTAPPQCAELLEKKGLGGLCSKIKDQIGYMDKIVSDLQDYARPVIPVVEERKIRQMLDEIVANVTMPENIRVSNTVDEEMLMLIDPGLMTRVFTNLITNAVQAMPGGGSLILRSHKRGDWICVSIADTGVGIPRENLDKIFAPTFTTKAKGQGFGLAVCKKLIEAHGGEITVESKPGEGSIFTVCIPPRRS
jgi:PAS domain S-box-containing protein